VLAVLQFQLVGLREELVQVVLLLGLEPLCDFQLLDVAFPSILDPSLFILLLLQPHGEVQLIMPLEVLLLVKPVLEVFDNVPLL